MTEEHMILMLKKQQRYKYKLPHNHDSCGDRDCNYKLHKQYNQCSELQCSPMKISIKWMIYPWEAEIEKREANLADARGLEASDACGGDGANVEGSNGEGLERHRKGVAGAAFPGRHNGPTQLSRAGPGPPQVGMWPTATAASNLRSLLLHLSLSDRWQ